jgi:alpha-glucosidase
VFSNHDVVRHATRYGLPKGPGRNGPAQAWLMSGGTEPALNRELGLRRARAASLLMLALPGSAYLYQGEELGLHEVVEIPDAARQDPAFFRNPGVDIGRDGCRVPLPWTTEGIAFGFGDAAAHLPQPEWFSAYAVAAQQDNPESTLSLYREALRLRSNLQTEEQLKWLEHPDSSVLHFIRPNGWQSVTNFGTELVELPAGTVLISSSPLTQGKLPADATAWII